MISYEVAADGDGWRPRGRRTGAVRLGASPAAAATVEATFAAASPGEDETQGVYFKSCALEQTRCGVAFCVSTKCWNKWYLVRVLLRTKHICYICDLRRDGEITELGPPL